MTTRVSNPFGQVRRLLQGVEEAEALAQRLLEEAIRVNESVIEKLIAGGWTPVGYDDGDLRVRFIVAPGRVPPFEFYSEDGVYYQSFGGADPTPDYLHAYIDSLDESEYYEPVDITIDESELWI